MKAAYLEDAEPSTVSDVLADVLKARGALLTERTHSHIRFEGLNPGRAYSFAKGGYVGTFRHAGEKDVEVRLKVEATAPARAFWGIVVLDLVVTGLLFATDPDASAWVSIAALLYALFGVALFLYVGTWRSSSELERAILGEAVARLRERPEAASRVLTEEDLRERAFEEELEAEITERTLKARRPQAAPAPAGGPPATAARKGFRLPFGRKGKGG